MRDFVEWLATFEGAVVWCGACLLLNIAILLLMEWREEHI